MNDDNKAKQNIVLKYNCIMSNTEICGLYSPQEYSFHFNFQLLHRRQDFLDTIQELSNPGLPMYLVLKSILYEIEYKIVGKYRLLFYIFTFKFFIIRLSSECVGV